jgi:alginate O-acetyltransferase complex protein AlgJ
VSARTVIATIALLFFFAPVGLRVVGVTARPFENRPLATPPKVAQGWDALKQGRNFLVDRMPLREQAVRADAWISQHVFDTAPGAGRANAGGGGALPFKAPPPAKPAQPAPAVAVDRAIAGRQGWLYLEGELSRACYPISPLGQTIARWERFGEIIRQSGRRVVIAMPPDKSTIYPEYLPAVHPLRACAIAGHRAIWQAIDGASDPSILGLRALMTSTKRPPPDESYYRKDTHWNTKGGVLALQAVLDRIGGGVRLRPDEIVRGRARYTGDLTNISGAPESDTSPDWTIRRRASAPTIHRRVLFVHDSYGSAMLDGLQAYAPGLTQLEWVAVTNPQLIAAIRSADIVILETVERELTFRASDDGLLTPAFRRALQRGLR